jgi:hypothetical protein
MIDGLLKYFENRFIFLKSMLVNVFRICDINLRFHLTIFLSGRPRDEHLASASVPRGGIAIKLATLLSPL